MFSKSIKFRNFQKAEIKQSTKNKLKDILKKDNDLIRSLSKNYNDVDNLKKIIKFKKKGNVRIIGMGGSILGSQAIYNFLNKAIKKKFIFINDLSSKRSKSSEANLTNLVISKSGNTVETMVNANLLIKKKQNNIFITDKKKPSYLLNLANELKAEIIHHKNYIGGRYSVLSEVGMIPAKLMGLDVKKFRQLDNIIKNNNFLNSLVSNVDAILNLVKKKKFNSIIINYDETSDYLFKWYQQLVAESLGKKGKGILPVISSMPRDNHSLIQLYLDGMKNNFYTFFYCKEKFSDRLKHHNSFSTDKFLKNQKISDIIFAQKKATENVFLRKKLPFRSFEVYMKDEKTLGELFCFFILETILLGRALNVNPFDQPSVELIKRETKNFFIK